MAHPLVWSWYVIAALSMTAVGRLTRRQILATGAGLLTGCALPWRRAAGPALPVAPPSPTPIRFGPPALRLVLTPEGIPALDAALRREVTEAARQGGASVDLLDLDGFRAGDPSVPHRLLVAVQAGVPPDALLLLGRQAQTARLRAMELAQDISALMRQAWRRYGGEPLLLEPFHIVEGLWVAAPHYQRLVGHWVRGATFQEQDIDPLAPESPAQTQEGLRQALTQVSQRTPGRHPWGIGSTDTADGDAWCWSVVHAWGGGLASLQGNRVNLDTPQTVAALEWMAQTLGVPPWRDAVHAHAAVWSDEEKNGAFVAGETAFTFTERLLATQSAASNGSGSGSGTAAALPADCLYLPTPGGPVNRPHAIAGAVTCWVLPRGAPAEPVERLLESLLQPEAQRRVWQAGGGLALPAFNSGWDDASLGALPGAANAQRFRREQTSGGFISATGNGGPETAASQAIGEARLGARMVREVLRGRDAREVAAETAEYAVGLFRDFGLPG